MPNPAPTRTTAMDRVRRATRSLHAELAREMGELGADQTVLAEQAGTMSGREWLGQWLRAEVPPPPTLGVLMGAEWVEVEDSRVAVAFEPAEWMFSPFGTVWGGLTATLLDIVLGGAIHTTLPAGTGYATSDLHVRYVRAMTPDTGRVVATGTAIHSGRRHASAEGRVEVEATGKLIATGTAGCPILRAS
jgi:uncharacterized protein (TIGR00369 family)